MDEVLTLHFDGGSRGNPGPAGCGVVVSAADGTELVKAGRFLGTMTNNQAEYQGLVTVLRRARDLGARQVLVIGDSELVIKQMKGQYKVRNAKLKPLWEEARALAEGFERVQFDHALREGNKTADNMANRAMDAKADVED